MSRQGYTTCIVDFTDHRNGFNMTVLSMLMHLTARLITCHGILLFSGFPEEDILSMLHLNGRLPLYDSFDKALDSVDLHHTERQRILQVFDAPSAG
jgi:hypothetical protein